mgnify:CR=1 FL=1
MMDGVCKGNEVQCECVCVCVCVSVCVCVCVCVREETVLPGTGVKQCYTRRHTRHLENVKCCTRPTQHLENG